jgi:hypothetical protein
LDGLDGWPPTSAWKGVGASACRFVALFDDSQAGRGRQLCPGISDVNFLGNLDSIVDLSTEIADGALNFGVTEQELNCTQISGSPGSRVQPWRYCGFMMR